MLNRRLIIILITFLSLKAFSQGIPSGGDGSGDLGNKKFNFVPVPYINYSRSLGFALGALPMAMYKLNAQDTISPAPITGLLGIYATNGTWFSMFFQRFYFSEDD